MAYAHQKLMYTLRFQTSAAALQELALDPTYLGGQIGLVGVLHTWTRALAYPPHIHSLVPGGALAPDGSRGRSPPYEDWLVPVRALSKLFRGKFQAALTTAGLHEHVPPQVWHKAWVTHWKPAGTGTEGLTYLAPDLHRTAITNQRLEKLAEGHGTFRVKEHGSGKWQHRTLPAAECIRRVLQHVLPKGFLKVRYYGVLRPHRRTTVADIRRRLAPSPCTVTRRHDGPNRPPPSPQPTLDKTRHCRRCAGQRIFVWHLSATKRAPP